jgi:hypothetical protein
MKSKKVLFILGVLLLLFIPAGVALAAPPFDTIVEEGETIPNDVVLFDGDLEIKAGATVEGDVLLFNGNAIVAGTVRGDLVLFNGNLDATGSADITGDCVTLNGRLNDETELGLDCTAVVGFENLAPMLSGLQDLPRLRDLTGLPGVPGTRVNVPSATSRFFSNLADAAGRSLVLGFLAFVAASLLPNHLQQVKGAVQQKPVASGFVGLLTAVAIPSLVALLLPVSILLTLVCIGLLGFPIMFALLLGLGAGALLGWITLGNLLGERLAGPLKLKNRSMPVTATLGTVILTFVIGLMGFGEGMVTFLVVCVGLGATALTKFGTKSYPLAAGNGPKVTAVLETLPVTEVADLKEGTE